MVYVSLFPHWMGSLDAALKDSRTPALHTDLKGTYTKIIPQTPTYSQGEEHIPRYGQHYSGLLPLQPWIAPISSPEHREGNILVSTGPLCSDVSRGPSRCLQQVAGYALVRFKSLCPE